jgi:hypothetical protein
MLLLGGTCLGTSRDVPPDSFALTATERDFAKYYPTYLANGHWSVASSLRGTDAAPSFMIGLMDYSPDDVSRPAALPNWNEIDYFDGVAWLNAAPVSSPSQANFRQTLDMRDGMLDTHYTWRNRGRRTEVTVTSRVSQSAPHLAAVTLRIVPRFSGSIRLRFALRASPAPQRLPLAAMTAEQFNTAAAASHDTDLAAGGKRDRIWYAGQVGTTAAAGDATAATLWMEGRAHGGRAVALGAAIALPRGWRMRPSVERDGADAVVLEASGRVRSGAAYRFTKFVAAAADGWGIDDGPPTGASAASAAARARDAGLRTFVAAHQSAWHALWRADVRVSGSPELQRTIHSDLFYLLENSAAEGGWPASACGFSGNYFGHVFWDNDFWVFPALLLLHPQRAESLIAFRQRTLPQARARAAAHGFAGAMYPWEADPWNGEDVTPRFALDNADREIHVTGAVALAQWHYYLASGDRRWLREKGFPVIKSAADFWASRAQYVAAARRYELLDVTSPEEDYLHVNNEIYTNAVAERSLQAAIAAAQALDESADPRWRTVLDGLYLPAASSDGRYFDFDPITPHDKTTSWMASSVPMLSIPALGFDADPQTLKGLLRHSIDAIAPIRGRANQMILVMLAIQAAVAGDIGTADDIIGARGGAADPFLKPPFNVRSETPQNDSVYLLATSGGFIQAFVFGLSGLRIGAAGLVEKFPAHLPRQISSLVLTNVQFRGRTGDITIARLPSGQVVRRYRWNASHE